VSARRPLAAALAWAPLAAGAALGAAAFLVACGDPAPKAPPGPPAVPPAEAPPAGAPAPGADSRRPAFLSSAECGSCHQEIYAEWKASWHGQAMTDPLFLKLSNDLQQEECIRCHAPVPLRETENWETPVARTDRREDAISCLTCHQSGGHVTGPHEGLSGPCRPVYDPDQSDVTKMCFACHNQHKTGEEWLAGPYAPDGPAPRQVEARNCIECHMPVVERPLVAGGPVRKGRRHTWPGGHSMDQLRRAAALEAETAVEDGAVRVRTWVTNVGAGHNLPTDARHRSFDVYVKLWDAEGNVVLDPLDPAQQARAQTAKYRLNYRNSNLVDTQIPPLARVSGLGAWKGEVRVPGLARGRGEAWLVYRLTPEDVLVPESLTDPDVVAYRARRVLSVPFEFGR
jgi:hypothetical protein